ncbi:MAG: DNA damage-inducible protein D [Bacilli bacterium]
MKNKLKQKYYKIFEDIKHINEYGNEYWEARELQEVLGYTLWQNFHKVIKRAMTSCEKSNNEKNHHFIEVNKTIKMPKNATKIIVDYQLSRYACYLIVQNGDPNKEVIALGQTYFAIQTRKQELTEEEYSKLNENERRLYIRKKTKNKNLKLYQAAMNADVKNFDKFTNCGYKGLYNGETADDIFKRKGLRYREDILDNMGSDELSYNEFRITLTEQKLVNEKIKGESKANDVHFEVGKAVRDTIERVGGIMPEQLPTPKKSIKELEKQNKKIVNK